MLSLDDSTARPKYLTRSFLGVLLALKVVLLVLYAINTAYVMDEYRHATFSLRLDQLYSKLIPIKTALWTVYYGVAFWLEDQAVSIMRVARLQSVVAGIGIVACTYATARNLGRDRLEAVFTVVVLMAFSTFMERAFRVRAEPLAVFFAASALFILTREAGGRFCQRALLAGLAAGLAFLTTQKAVYLVVGLGLGILAQELSRSGFIVSVRQAAVFSLGWAVALLGYAVYFKGAEFAELIRSIFVRPVDLALNAQKAYSDLDRYIWQTLTRNAGVYALCVAGLGLSARRLRKLSAAERLALVFTVVVTLLVFRHKQPWPYVFLMCLPALSLWAVEVPRIVRCLTPRVQVFIYCGLGLVLLIGIPRNIQYLQHDNRHQESVVTFAESLLGKDDRYFDSIGMISSRFSATFDWWAVNRRLQLRDQLASGDATLLERILEQEPKLWILNYRMASLWRWLGPHLDTAYVAVSPNVLLSGTVLDAGNEPGNKKFNNWWAGEYRLYSSGGQPITGDVRVGGRPVDLPVRLAAGLHAISWPARSEPAFLLPVGMPATIRPHATATRFPTLFSRIYTY